MLDTEREMSARRCPLAPILFILDAINPETRNGLAAGGAQVSGNCIGSKCALWCWFDYTRDGKETYGGGQFEKGRAEPPSPGMPKKAPRLPRGFCGLIRATE